MSHTTIKSFRQFSYFDKSIPIICRYSKFYLVSLRQTNINATICRPEWSKRAAELYNENRYPSHEVCRRSCTKMKISTVYLARYVNEDKMTSYVTFNFGKLIDVSVEVESYRFLNMVAEIGGET